MGKENVFPNKGGHLTSMTSSPVDIQISPQSLPSIPSWFSEVTLVAHALTRYGVLDAIGQRVRFARRRFGRYDVIDFVAVLIGYTLSGEPTLEAFYARLLPFASAFMALFGRDRLPHRSTLSRFLAAMDQPVVRRFGLCFSRIWWREQPLPRPPELPSPHRRLEPVCAPGYLGRKRGEVVRISRNWLRCTRVPVHSTTTAATWKIFSRPFPKLLFLTFLSPMKPSLPAMLMGYGAGQRAGGRDRPRPETRLPTSPAPSFP
jgi:hypothetical protein